MTPKQAEFLSAEIYAGMKEKFDAFEKKHGSEYPAVIARRDVVQKMGTVHDFIHLYNYNLDKIYAPLRDFLEEVEGKVLKDGEMPRELMKKQVEFMTESIAHLKEQLSHVGKHEYLVTDKKNK